MNINEYLIKLMMVNLVPECINIINFFLVKGQIYSRACFVSVTDKT